MRARGLKKSVLFSYHRRIICFPIDIYHFYVYTVLIE